jgi:hypothetical protein
MRGHREVFRLASGLASWAPLYGTNGRRLFFTWSKCFPPFDSWIAICAIAVAATPSRSLFPGWVVNDIAESDSVLGSPDKHHRAFEVRLEAYGRGRTKRARITDSIVNKPKAAQKVDLVGGIEGIGDVPHP